MSRGLILAEAIAPKMTSEVCVMNRLAVVLAADSATTVKSISDQGLEERYFKGANKIFQLSTHQPVGMMIFNSADLLKVPWEVIVKQFRSSLERKSFNTLDGYASEFFAFLNESTTLFPLQVQKEVTAQVGDLVQDRRRDFAKDVGSPVRASMMAQPCFLAVEKNERMSAKSTAPSTERKPPEIFWRNFIMRPSRSA